MLEKTMRLRALQEEFEKILEVPEAARALEDVGVDPVSVVPRQLLLSLSRAS